MTSKDKIKAKAVEIIGDTEKGLRYSELTRAIHDALPDIPINTIHGTVWNLDVTLPEVVYKPARGVFRHSKYREKDEAPQPPPKAEPPAKKVQEEDFYAPFADWIKNELEECTKAIKLGGNRFKDKWGTPDVVGIRSARQSDIVKLPTEIVSVEIKIDSGDLITAFGQACSYKLFSHKSYIVVPVSSSEGDTARLDALCRIFGVGLILFDSTTPMEPDFQIRVRAAKHEPDMFYVNKYMKLVEDELFS
jgi:hypothetical protein